MMTGHMQMDKQRLGLELAVLNAQPKSSKHSRQLDKTNAVLDSRRTTSQADSRSSKHQSLPLRS